MRIEETLVTDKATKRTIRYASLKENDPVTMVYIAKDVLGARPPERITLIIEADGN